MSAFASRKLKQAQELLQRGNAAAATSLCEEVLQRAPRNPEALCLLGIAQLVGGDAERALPLLEQAASTQPRYGLALEHLGLANLMLGRFADAERSLRDAAALPAAPPTVHMRLGISLLQQNRGEEALAALRKAVHSAPEDPDGHLNLAHAYAQTGEHDTARRHLETVLRLDPARVEARFNLGVLALQRDELDAAQQWFEAVLEREPRYLDALINLGVVHQKRAQADAAAACFRRALTMEPGHALASKNLADVLMSQGQPEEARDRYHVAVQSAANFVEAREGLAAAYLKLGRFTEAMASLRELLRMDPGHGKAWSALAEAHFQCGELADAESAARRAIEIDPGVAGPYSVLAVVHVVRGELDRAIAALEDGCSRTGAGTLLGMLAYQLRHACDWPKWQAAWDSMAARIEKEAALGSPFWLLCEPTTAEQQCSYTRRWAAERFAAISPGVRRAGGASRRPPRLRVGYLSSDLQEHAAAYLVTEVLELHDRQRFEVFAYSHGPDDQGEMRRRVRAACEHFIDITWEPDDIAATRIREDDLDILVDLKGYTAGERLTLMARRPCDVQVTWLGYPGTTGAAFMDYLIADPFIIPPGSEAAYSERVVRLPHCYQPNDRRRTAAEPLPRAEYGLPQGSFVFCCFNQTYKITPDVFEVWMRLLRAVPAGVLWLVESNRWATHNLREAARAQGVAPERLIFAGRRPYAEHLARYRAVDLALDTFPYTSHTILSDAMWCGCPTVGLCGETFASRVSGSLLTAAHMPDLITYSLADYEKLAFRLATEPSLLRELRARAARARDHSPLFDSTTFARDLEELYLGIARRDASLLT
ncbi:MAG TPA: tetratricopeptide repeat protein [Burkholderiales bacterium]|nr:tetratricopeptide repeat protein [Burkholderiales bacterium]